MSLETPKNTEPRRKGPGCLKILADPFRLVAFDVPKPSKTGLPFEANIDQSAAGPPFPRGRSRRPCGCTLQSTPKATAAMHCASSGRTSRCAECGKTLLTSAASCSHSKAEGSFSRSMSSMPTKLQSWFQQTGVSLFFGGTPQNGVFPFGVHLRPTETGFPKTRPTKMDHSLMDTKERFANDFWLSWVGPALSRCTESTARLKAVKEAAPKAYSSGPVHVEYPNEKMGKKKTIGCRCSIQTDISE